MKTKPEVVVAPIQLNIEDFLICKKIAYQVKCFFVDESIYEIINGKKLPNSHFSSKSIDMTTISYGRKCDACLDFLSNQDVMDPIENFKEISDESEFLE